MDVACIEGAEVTEQIRRLTGQGDKWKLIAWQTFE